MKSILKLAVGAAIAGALVQVLARLAERRMPMPIPEEGSATGRPGDYYPTELVADTSSVGEGSGDDRVQLPDDGRLRTN
jgi:hypothetical protein